MKIACRVRNNERKIYIFLLPGCNLRDRYASCFYQQVAHALFITLHNQTCTLEMHIHKGSIITDNMQVINNNTQIINKISGLYINSDQDQKTCNILHEKPGQ
jgi:hypothetical protein